MNAQKISDLKPGDYFRLITKTGIANPVYVRGDYDRSSKRFSIYKFENVNAERFVKGSALVTTDIDF